MEVEDLLLEIISFFNAEEMISFESTSKYFNKISSENNKQWFVIVNVFHTYSEDVSYKNEYIKNRPEPLVLRKPTDFIVEYSKSSKSQCRMCRRNLEEKEMRFGRKGFMGGFNYFHVEKCGLTIMSNQFNFAKEIPGFKSLDKIDKEKLSNLFLDFTGNKEIVSISEDAVVCDFCERLIIHNFYEFDGKLYCTDCKKSSSKKSFKLIKFKEKYQCYKCSSYLKSFYFVQNKCICLCESCFDEKESDGAVMEFNQKRKLGKPKSQRKKK
eukprot:gene1525-12651_t